MIGRSGERGSGMSVLVARHDDEDDDDIYYVKNAKRKIHQYFSEFKNNNIFTLHLKMTNGG